jgi:hypothetical protein
MDNLVLLSNILTDKKVLTNTLQLLDARMQRTGIADPELALCRALNIMEKIGNHFEDPFVVE